MIKNYSFLFSYFQKIQFPNILKISFFLFLFSNISYGQVTENFDNWTDGSYGGISTYGEWVSDNAMTEYQDSRSGKCVRLRNATNSYLQYVGTDGSGKDGGVGVISFWYRSWNTSPTAVYDVQVSINGAAYTNVGNQISTTSTSYAQWSHTLNSSENDIKIKIINVSGERLKVDDFEITDFASSDPSVTFDAATSAVDETDADVVITNGIPVTLTNYAADVTITPTVNGSSSAEAGDYTIDLTPLTFSGNETKYIPLTIKDDLDSDNETVIIDFTVTSGTADLGTSNHTVSITDNESPPVPSIIITEVTDPKDQYLGRFVEIYNNGATDINLDTEQIYIAIQSNGSTVSSTALSGILAANEVMIIGNSSNINTHYGFDADKNYGSITGNGDDGYFLYYGGSHSSGTLIDSYGVLGQDGTGETWEYLDSRAYRNSPKSTSPNATWTQAEWTVETTDKNLADMTPGALEDEYRYDGDWKPRDVYSNASSTDDVYISSSVTLTDNLTVTNFE